jgi:raffinose/stachyose/melibiose transport system permease protein
MNATRTARIIKLCCILLLFAYFMLPFYLMLLNSLKTTEQFVAAPFGWPKVWRFDNYTGAFRDMNFPVGFINTVVITLLSVAGILLTSSMCAYYIVRHNRPLTRAMFAVFVAAMVVPFQSVMIPLVSLYGNLNLLNNKWILIFMYLGFGQALAVFIFHGFIKGVPLELEEAALIDGCNLAQTFFRIVLPLLKSVMMTVLVLDVLWVWNDYLLPSLVLLSPRERTLPLSTYSFFSSYSVDFAPLMAGIVLTIIPILIIFLICQKYIIEGVVKGAIK